jgi:glyoxylase-like metal-dependent hydrolase (beta-lactamase superfamily II)
MDYDAYRFTVGNFTCMAVRDGGLNYQIGHFFANVDREDLEPVLRLHALPADRIYTPYTCLLVETGEYRVLIDTGAGDLARAIIKATPNIDHTSTVTGLILQNLNNAGIDASSIDLVVFTHAHPDHVGGTMLADGSLAYPNARYVIGETEWHFWFSEDVSHQVSQRFIDIARRNLQPIRDSIMLAHDGDEIVPGITVVDTPGHTPGHIAVRITSRDQTLLHISDVVLHPLHLEHPDWLPVFDVLPPEAATSKRRIFDEAAAEQHLVFAHHFPPFPNLGHVHKNGQGWRWEPLATIQSPM